jgi:hypothetical protein
MGECLSPFHDERTNRMVAVCDLCRARAVNRGWSSCGEPEPRKVGRMRVEILDAKPLDEADEFLLEPADEPEPHRPAPRLAPELAVLSRVSGIADEVAGIDTARPDMAPQLLNRIRTQDAELAKLRRELDPLRRAEEQRQLHRQREEIRELRALLAERDARIQRLQQARHAETSPMRMSRFALDAFNQSDDLDRMARIARTLGAPIVNVHDEGPGIPRRVRLTLAWDIAWYEFVVKLDLGANRASVHETGTGGDPTKLPLERRRPNAEWRDSGIVI